MPQQNLTNSSTLFKYGLYKSSKTSEDLAVLKSVDLRNYLLIGDSSVTTSPDRIKFRRWFKDGNSLSDYQQ